MWESPIEIIKTDIQTHYEEKVMEAVISCGINVNKEELIKALQYDRQQYEKGYEDAKAEQQWIPCSERLPKTHGNYYVTEKRFSIDDKNRTGKFTLETAYAYYGNHWQRAKFLEVVAWMPAEPYQGKRKGEDV